ncbi:MAG: molybdenum cofactor biosynthesis protein MoaE [Gemmatimonadota bacterium]|nr:molybdenum cofactor biosynthesis protein MoaE [Gemmatimonadota bacterium]
MARLTHRPIDLNALLEAVQGVDCGATAVFLGSVRQSDEDGPVEFIEYSAYEEMAESEFEAILKETEKRSPGVRLVGMHRLGRVPVGEASIAVVAASGHRAEAFDALRFAVEEAKKRLPIWKKEFLEGGETRWRGNTPTENVES